MLDSLNLLHFYVLDTENHKIKNYIVIETKIDFKQKYTPQMCKDMHLLHNEAAIKDPTHVTKPKSKCRSMWVLF